MAGSIELQGRQHWADSLRGLAVALVVVQHSSGVPQVILGQESPGAVWDGLTAALAPFRIPTLLVLSGLLLPRSVSKPLFTYVDGKVRKVLWPFLLWSVLTVMAAGVGKLATVDAWGWIGGPFHMWYLSVLLVGYAAGIAVRWVPAWLLGVAFMTLLAVADPSTNAIRRALFYGALFFLGAALRSFLVAWIQAHALLAAVLGSAGFAVGVASALGHAPIGPNQPWSLFLVLPGVLAVIWGWYRLPRFKMLEAVGKRSMVLYAVHFPVQILVSRGLSSLGAGPNVIVLTCLIAGFGVPLLGIKIYEQIEFLFVLPQLSSPRNIKSRLPAK